MENIPLRIPHDHPAYAGHFPGMPITPGVVLLDEVLYAIAQHAHLGAPPRRLNSVKFLNPVLPNAALEVHYEIRSNGNIQFDIKEKEQIMASGVFSA